MDNINDEMADILGLESVSDADDLTQFEMWDSLAVLSIVTFIDEAYNIQLTNNDLEGMTTLGEIKSLVSTKTPQ